MSKYLPSVCPHDCPSACALEVERIDRKTIGKVRGAKENNYTLGVVCTKVAKYAERVHHPDRLKEPMVRTGKKGSGEFKVVTWDEALDRVEHAFTQAAKQYGEESIWPYYYGGTMGQIQRDGIIRFKNALGYSGQIKTICTQIAYAGWTAGAGSVRGADPREIAHSDLIVIWGCNAVATQINLMKHVAIAQRERGAKVVVIDPSVTGTAKKADTHLALKPGTDGALAASIMHCAFRDKQADWDYLNKMSDDPIGLQNALKDKTPAWAAEITGLEVEQIEQFATQYNSTKRSFIRLGIGFSRSRNGAHNVHSVSCLPVVSGAWQHKGGGALLGTSAMFRLDKTLIEGLDLAKSPSRDLDMSRIGSILLGKPDDLKKGPPIKAMLIQNTNPMAVAPDLNAVHKGFAREDLFVCVHEQFMTETAKMADIVLPATSCVEHDDLYTTYGQVHLQVSKPVIEPYANCRSNHEVICALAKRLGSTDLSFDMSAVEMISQALEDSNYPDYETLLERKWFDCSDDVDMKFENGFDWPNGKFRLKANWPAAGDDYSGMPVWPGYWNVTTPTSSDTPFRLTTPTERNFLNTSFSQSPCALKVDAKPTVRINPKDALAGGIKHDSVVEIGNELGTVQLHAYVTENVNKGVLEARGIWPGDAYIGNIGINVLISAKSAQPNGGATFHDAAVWLKVCEQ